MSISAQNTKLMALTVAVVLVAATFWLFHVRGPTQSTKFSVSNVKDASAMMELRDRAKKGDDAARMELHLFLGDSEEGRAMYAAALKNDYGPAVAIELQSMFATPNTDAYREAYQRAERVGKNGSLSAAIALAYCKLSGECGQPSTAEAYKWASVATAIAAKRGYTEAAIEHERVRLSAMLPVETRLSIDQEVSRQLKSGSFFARP